MLPSVPLTTARASSLVGSASPTVSLPAAPHAAAVAASTALASRQTLITQARHTLLATGAAPPPTQIEPWIARSWQRCLARGLAPAEPIVFDAVSAPTLRRSQEENRPLLQAARPVLEQLTRAVAGMHYFAMLTDAQGVVLDVHGPCDRSDPRAAAIGRPGIDLSEASVGTTAIGAALAELQPVWLHRGEHFFNNNGSYSCAGAPLFDPQGHCMGMLDLTGVDVPERPELRHLVARSARAMEDALLLQQPHALLLRVNWPGGPLGSEGDGLLTLDADGFVLGCNSMARQLVPQPLRLPHTRAHCSDLLALPWASLFDAADRHHTPPLDLPLWSGLRLQALAVLPQGARSHRGRPLSAAQDPALRPHRAASDTPAPLRETEAAMIRQAVQHARGNVAEAARALGISRATVYRKLGAPRRPIAGDTVNAVEAVKN